MRKFIALSILLSLTLSSLSGQGYYKDIFMDGGIKLTSRKDLPAARRLGLSIEHFVTGRDTKESPLTPQDTVMQEKIMVGSDIDVNGHLLYPDGQPRFKVIYVNGGRAASHGRSLTAKGRDNIRQFVENGGSYVGTCAGMFIATSGTTNVDPDKMPREEYLHIWPGITNTTGLLRTPTGHFIEPGSPLLKYYDYGGDMYIDNVYHNGGGFIVEDHNKYPVPAGTEILTRYDYPEKTNRGKDIHNKISSWAIKSSEESGRIVLTGSHPESVTSGERLDMMSALILYAMDGLGKPVIKGELKKGEVREMTKSTEAHDPAYTKIGDKQYHHFTVNIPRRAKNITVTLEGPEGYDLNLYMGKDGPAFIDNAQFVNIKKGATKAIFNKKLDRGVWHIAVECDTTVDVVETQWGEMYSGNLSVLNGVPYSISVNWK